MESGKEALGGRVAPAGRPGNLMSRLLAAGAVIGAAAGLAHAAPPRNDSCGNATIIPATSADFADALDTSEATSDPGDPLLPCTGSAHDFSVWYQLRPACDGQVTIETCGSDYDTAIAIYTGTCGTPVPLPDGCADSGCGDGKARLADVPLDADTVYLIEVVDDGVAPTGGLLQFNLHFEPAEPAINDFCEDAVTVQVSPFTDVVCTAFATIGPNDAVPTCTDFGGRHSNSVWYRLTPPTDSLLSIDTEGSNYDTVLVVYEGTCGDLTEIACDDDSGTGSLARITDVPLVGGQTYYIEAADFNESPRGGTLQIRIETVRQPQPPDNDECANARVITETPFFGITKNTDLATSSPDDPDPSCTDGASRHTNTVWYAFTPPEDGLLTLDTEGSNYDTVLYVGTGACGALGEVGCDNDSGTDGLAAIADLPVLGGVTYWIEIADFGDDPGGGTAFLFADFQPAQISPPNDDCTAATVIGGSAFTDTVPNIHLATSGPEDADPTCTPGDRTHANTVWYAFAPSECGLVTIDTIGSNYDTVLLALRGTCDGYVEVGCNDDADGLQSRLADLVVLPAEPYLVEVAAWNPLPDDGLLSFHYAFTPLAGPDCNNNGTPDACDIASGDADDCNANGVPDECDIADGTSRDDNGNGMPDECECGPADFDCDGDVDIVDFTTFAGCFTGSGVPVEQGCEPADLDGDGDVDIVDFNTFAGAFTGSQ